MNTQLSVEVQKALAQNDEEQLKVLVEKIAKDIFQRITQVTEKIERSEQMVKEAENVKASIFERIGDRLSFGVSGDTTANKRSRLNTKAISMNNEALVEINAIIKESVALTCCSIAFAKNMIEVMSVMMTRGFKNVDGRTTILTEDQKKHAEVILQQARNFIEHQAEYEERQEKQEREIEQNRENISQNRQNISQNRENILTNQQTINQNRESIAKNAEAIEHLKSKNSSQSLIVSIIALVISIVSLALHFIH